jgi:hypothetical protein
MAILDYEFWRRRALFPSSCYIACDADGFVYCYEREPEAHLDDGEWVAANGSFSSIGYIGLSPGDSFDYIEADDNAIIEGWDATLMCVPAISDPAQVEYFELQEAFSKRTLPIMHNEDRGLLCDKEATMPLLKWDFFDEPQHWPSRLHDLDMRSGRNGLYSREKPGCAPYYVYSFEDTTNKEFEDELRRAAKAVA